MRRCGTPRSRHGSEGWRVQLKHDGVDRVVRQPLHGGFHGLLARERLTATALRRSRAALQPPRTMLVLV
jgi:hypothetical protein